MDIPGTSGAILGSIASAPALGEAGRGVMEATPGVMHAVIGALEAVGVDSVTRDIFLGATGILKDNASALLGLKSTVDAFRALLW